MKTAAILQQVAQIDPELGNTSDAPSPRDARLLAILDTPRTDKQSVYSLDRTAPRRSFALQPKYRWALIGATAAAASFVAIAWPGSPTITPASAQLVDCPKGVNAEGETYGSWSEDAVIDEFGVEISAPDLICAVNRDGLFGYLRVEDLRMAQGPEPKNPKAAIREMEARQNTPAPTLTLFDADGVTIVGSWDGLSN